jgi:TonB family protein
MTCIQAEREDAKSEVHAICLEAASHELLSNEWPEPPDLKKREQFADYFDFEGGRYPRSLEFLVNSNRTLSANETSVSPAPFEPALLVPPKGAIERRMCPGMKHPEGIERFRSIYKGAGTPEGEITVSFSVLTDGSVDDIQIIRSGGKTVDQMTVAAVKRFKYKPAMCGDEPVVSDMQVTYRTRP